MPIGKYLKHPEGYFALIPARFPDSETLTFNHSVQVKAAKAERLVGKLDGITHILPDADFFLNMYVAKDAAFSAQIEGTKATLMDALEQKAGVNLQVTDADDILYYIKALNYGIEQLKSFPFSLRFIRELHTELMTGARSTHFSDPGQFRRSQNWIGGTTPSNAAFVPPPVAEMTESLNDLEDFIHSNTIMPIIQVALLHAQFETIHPFLDGNGRTGRLMVTLFLYERAVLERPVLFLSAYFKKHQQLYYERLNGYHHNKVTEWLHFFLDAVIETAQQSIDTSKRITSLREADMLLIQSLGKREATSGVRFLQYLFSNPIVTSATVLDKMGFTRPGAIKLIDRFTELGILRLREEASKYGRTYIYSKYVNIFTE